MTIFLVTLAFIVGCVIVTIFFTWHYYNARWEHQDALDKEITDRRNDASIIASKLLLIEQQIKSLENDNNDLRKIINNKKQGL